MKKRAIAILCLLTMAISMVASGCQGKVVAYKRGTPVPYYKNTWRGIDEDVFFISGYIGPQATYAANGYQLPSLLTDEVYAMLAECGINNITEQRMDIESEVGAQALSLAAKYGITYLMRCTSVINAESKDPNGIYCATTEEITAKLEGILNKYENLSGIYVSDEPPSSCYPRLADVVKSIEAARETLGASDFQGYINAYPNIGWRQLSNDTDETMTWTKYLSSLAETGIDYLMFDMYPYTNVPGEVSAGWLNSLGTINKIAKEYQLPWYGYIQCGGGRPSFTASHRVVNEGEMNYNVGSMLAFGCKGLSYYTLVAIPEGAPLGEEYVNNDSILNKYGTKTPFFYYAKKINAQLQAMAPVILNAAHEGVILDNQDSPNVYTGDDLLESYRCLKGYSGDGALIGCLDYEGTVALVVVNNSIENNHAVITLEFDENYAYEVTQRAQKFDLSGKEISLHLEVGEFALVVVQ